ncbi:hypothetical protein FBU30_010126 [Linnemannia zychae]|nr:hypothetical protein FBU30_010126 [Linnemannia zychae]
MEYTLCSSSTASTSYVSSSDSNQYYDTRQGTTSFSSESRPHYGYGLHDDIEDEDDDDNCFAPVHPEVDTLQLQYNQQQSLCGTSEAQEEPQFTPFPWNASSYIGSEDTKAEIQEEQLYLMPETSYTTRTPSYLHLEIQELPGSHDNNAGNEHRRYATYESLPRPRQFIFEPNTRLLLGRAPSSGMDPKARLKQLSEVKTTNVGEARAENGYDDGLFTNQVVSKLHAAIFSQDGQLVIEDWESTHGTYVNDEPITRRVLQDLDRIRLGRPVVRKDIHFSPLEFVARIQQREYYTLPPVWDPIDSTAAQQSEVGTPTTVITDTPENKRTATLLDEDIGKEEGTAAVDCVQIDLLDVMKPIEPTTMDEQSVQDSDDEENIMVQQTPDDYEIDKDKLPALYDGSDVQASTDDCRDDEDQKDIDEQLDQEYIFDDEEEPFLQQALEFDVKVDAPVVNVKENKDNKKIDETLNVPIITQETTFDQAVDFLKKEEIQDEAPSTIKTTTLTTLTTTVTTAASEVSPSEEATGTQNLKRKHDEIEGSFYSAQQQEMPQPKLKKTALIAAALAGVIVGSVGTVLTLANI